MMIMSQLYNKISLLLFSLIVFVQRELVLKAKEMFVTHGPWLVHGSLDKLKVHGCTMYVYSVDNIICVQNLYTNNIVKCCALNTCLLSFLWDCADPKDGHWGGRGGGGLKTQKC